MERPRSALMIRIEVVEVVEVGAGEVPSSVESIRVHRPSVDDTPLSIRSFRNDQCFPHHLAAQPRPRSQGPALRLRGGGIDIVVDDDADDDSSDDRPAHGQLVGDEDDSEDQDEEDHDGDYEDEDEDEGEDVDESPADSAVDDEEEEQEEDDGGLEYADDPAAVHAYQQEQQLRYQQQGWTSTQHEQYQREKYQQEHQRYWQQQQPHQAHQHEHQHPGHPRVIAIEDYVEDGDEGEVVYHKVVDTSHKRAWPPPPPQQQQQASTSQAPVRQHVVAPRYPQFAKRPYDPNAPPQVAFTDDELLGDLPDDEESDYPRISNKAKGKARARDSDEEEAEEELAGGADQNEEEDVEEELYALLQKRKKPSLDDEDMPHDDDDDDPKEPHPLNTTDNWLSDDAVAKWAETVALKDKPVPPKPIYSEMGAQRFKDEMERKHQEEIKAREPAPFRPDARTVKQVGFEPVVAAPGTATTVTPATPPPGPPQVFALQRRRGWNDGSLIDTEVQVLPPRVGGLTSSSPLPSPAAAPSALSMSLTRGMGGQQGMYPGYSPGTAQQQLPPSLPQPLVAHHYRRQQQQQQQASLQAEPEIRGYGGLSARPVAMPAIRRGRGRSRSLDSSRSPSLALRQGASSADFSTAKLRQELKKSRQRQAEKERVQEAELMARTREERGVQTGSRTEGSSTVRTARTRVKHRGRSGKPTEQATDDYPSPTTSVNAMPPSTHRPLPPLRSYRSRGIGTTDLAALRPAALNITARPSVGVDDRTVHSATTSAATSTTSLLLGGSGSEVAALENWTPFDRPPAEGAPRRSATTSSNVSPLAASPVIGHSPSGSGSRYGSRGMSTQPSFSDAAAGVHPAVAAAFQGPNPHFYNRTWGYIYRRKRSSSQSNSEDQDQPTGPAPANLPQRPIHQQSSAPQAHSASAHPAIAHGYNSASTQPANTQPSQASGGGEANGNTGRRRSATNPIPRIPTPAQLLLQQSGYNLMSENVYGREREWKRNGDDRENMDVCAPRRQDFQRGIERERDRGRGGAEESSTAPPQQQLPSRALQRQQEGPSSFRAHDQSFRSNQRQRQIRQRPSASNDNGGIVSDGGSAESGDISVDAGYSIEQAASAHTRAGGRGRRREERARGKRTAGATIPDAELEPCAMLEPQSARSTRFPTHIALNHANSPPSPSYLDASAGAEPGRSPYGRRVRARNGDFCIIDPYPNSRSSTQSSSIRSAQPTAGASPRGFPLIVPPMPRRNRLIEGGSSHPSQRLAYSFTGAQTPSTSLLAASHFLGVNPARLTGGNRSDYGGDYDAHDLFLPDGGSVHSVPSDSVARGRPAVRANA